MVMTQKSGKKNTVSSDDCSNVYSRAYGNTYLFMDCLQEFKIGFVYIKKDIFSCSIHKQAYIDFLETIDQPIGNI